MGDSVIQRSSEDKETFPSHSDRLRLDKKQGEIYSETGTRSRGRFGTTEKFKAITFVITCSVGDSSAFNYC